MGRQMNNNIFDISSFSSFSLIGEGDFAFKNSPEFVWIHKKTYLKSVKFALHKNDKISCSELHHFSSIENFPHSAMQSNKLDEANVVK